jgi:hypothetical protein
VALRAVRDLPNRGRGLAEGLRDLVVRHVEDLAQHEDHALVGAERLQHGEHRDGHALREPASSATSGLVSSSSGSHSPT